MVGRLQTQGLLSSYALGSDIAVAPRISPPTSPTINGLPASPDTTALLGTFSAAATLDFTWRRPALGSPTGYTVSIWEVADPMSPDQMPQFQFSLQTQGLSASLGKGALVAGRTYAAVVTATAGDADRFASGVLAADVRADSADCLTSAFSIQ
jgi:hypothetical protein